MSLYRTGVTGRLCLSTLLILAIPVFAQSQPLGQPQSLGAIARQLRAERQQSGAHHKVYTNEDLAGPSASSAPAPSADGDDQHTQAEANSPASGNATAGKAGAADEAAAKEAELQKRTQEINQQYLDRIAGLRNQIATAKQDLERLQRDQVESTNQFRSTNGVQPSIYEYEQQQRLFGQQIEAQRNLIVSLNGQLEDAQEAARHAGVPHATD